MGMLMSKKSQMSEISFLLDQFFSTLTFYQTMGTPMGSPPALFMANLFLFTYESKRVLNTMKSNLKKARKFVCTFCFEYDLCVINDKVKEKSEFEKILKEIYSPELLLKKENTSFLRPSFLDLEINYHYLSKDAKQGYLNTQPKSLLNKLFGKHFESIKRFAKSFIQLFRMI